MKDSKTERILNWLNNGRPITQIMAIQMFDCMDLKGIIYRLRKNGVNIKSEKCGKNIRYFIDNGEE